MTLTTRWLTPSLITDVGFKLQELASGLLAYVKYAGGAEAVLDVVTDMGIQLCSNFSDEQRELAVELGRELRMELYRDAQGDREVETLYTAYGSLLAQLRNALAYNEEPLYVQSLTDAGLMLIALDRLAIGFGSGTPLLSLMEAKKKAAQSPSPPGRGLLEEPRHEY